MEVCFEDVTGVRVRLVSSARVCGNSLERLELREEPFAQGLLVQDTMVGLSRNGRRMRCLLTSWFGVALRGSVHVEHSDSDSEGLRGKEEELSENCDYNLIER